MKEFTFEFADQRYLVRLLIVCFLSLIIFLISSVALLVDSIGIFGCMTIAFGFPIVLFFLLKKNIKKIGTAIIAEDSVEFKSALLNQKILYSDIKFYVIQQYKSIALIIKPKTERKFTLQANPNFCNTDPFRFLCSELDKSLQQYKLSHQADLVRKKSW